MNNFIVPTQNHFGSSIQKRGLIMRYGDFVFYDTEVLTLDDKSAVIRDCKDVASP